MQFKVFIHQRQVAVIHIEIPVKCDYRLNLCKYADTLGQLQQECPCRSTLYVRTGQHINQVFQFLRHRNLGHIDCKNIGSNHILARIDDAIGNGILSGCIGNHAIPCQQAVTTGCLVEVKTGFALRIQGDRRTSRNGCVASQGHCDFGVSDIAGLVACENESIDRARRRNFQCEHQITGSNRHSLAIVQCLDR